MPANSDISIWEKELVFFEEEKEKFPEKFYIPEEVRSSLNTRVGILENFNDLPLGYVKYSPYDFIVEEVLQDGTIITADDDESPLDPALEGEGTVYVDVVKLGFSTLDAVDKIAHALSIQKKQIGYAGIKDAVALTAQRISIRGTSVDAVSQLSIPGIIIKNVRVGKGALQAGYLKGNRFTLFIRTNGAINEPDFLKRVEKISTQGVMNYFGTQRFGSPRYLSHLFGLYIIKGDIEGLVRSVLTDESPFEWPYVREIRREAAGYYGNWKAMSVVLSRLPNTFRHELGLLEALEGATEPRQYLRALRSIQKQIEFWPKSYSSYLANRVLSKMAMGDMQRFPRLPLLISRVGAMNLMYANFLKSEGLDATFLKNLKKFPYLHVADESYINTVITPESLEVGVVPGGVVVSFVLEKGAYATTVLMNMFSTPIEEELPEWLDTTFVDTKAVLGRGDLNKMKDYFDPIAEKMLKK